MPTPLLSRLDTAATFTNEKEETAIDVSYKTGASYVGKIYDLKKNGSGVFTWADGSNYEGQYVDNQRHGKGVQTFADQSSYEGDFSHDLRHGKGLIQWANGETYKGVFFKDRRHGKGKYSWPNGSTYSGMFYLDKKEGFGLFKFPNGDLFKGLYKSDEREGPGILMYANDTQDVGYWWGERMLRLLVAVEGGFSMADYPEFKYPAQENTVPIPAPPDKTDVIKDILHPPTMLDYQPQLISMEKLSQLYSDELDARSLAVDHEMFHTEFFKDVEQADDSSDHLAVWNRTPVLVNMQLHVNKFAQLFKKPGSQMNAIFCFDRSMFGPAGAHERASEEMLRAATEGNCKRVEELLNSGVVHPDVGDKRGHTALIAATVGWHVDVINALLNQGANVNQLNDEGVSALAAGALLFYPSQAFVFNIAERDMLALKQAEEENEKDKSKDQKEASSEPGKAADQSTGKMERSKSVGWGSKGGDVPVVTVNAEEGGRTSANSNQRKESPKGPAADNRGHRGAGEQDFESNASVRNYPIQVPDKLIERCATQLSMNQRVVSREAADLPQDKARQRAVQISLRERMKETLALLLRRGADPKASCVPMPVLFFAIKAADVDMVRTLLLKGASTSALLPEDKGSLSALHIAAAIPGEAGVQMTQLLLDALADPDARAKQDDSFLNKLLEEEWTRDEIDPQIAALLGGRTPLQIACAREEDHKNACSVVQLLLRHKANPNLICNGFSPLALAIASGNDLAVEELLLHGADPSLALTHGIGSALCVAASTEYEHRRTLQERLQLINRLIEAGADVLAPILIGPRRVVGTAVDFAYYMFNQDRRIAHIPYHALTPAERETYNARRRLLAHLGDTLRVKAVEQEQRRLKEEEEKGLQSRSPSASFIFTGAGAPLPPGVKVKPQGKSSLVTFEPGSKSSKKNEMNAIAEVRSGVMTIQARSCSQVKRLAGQIRAPIRKPLLRYCYECGRSVGVRLTACTRCKEVFYCSKACKLKAWNARHKDECLRVPGQPPNNRGTSKKDGDSPTPASNVQPKQGSKDKAKFPTRLFTHSARITQLLEVIDQRRTKPFMSDHRDDAGAAKRPFTTEDGRTVYMDNYSYE